ncbi:MAG: AAA family ATPase [Alphaproteobacteria bacterium]|nr:AAA family ATPase [Alphaproteobacteria bacterium]
MAHEDLIAWAEKQPPWARDALRRHALKPNYELSAEDKAAVTKRVRQAAGIPSDENLDCFPFRSEHLKGAAEPGPRTLLCSLGSVENLARLAANQTLRFALDGITLIYGDNGTGKSGYCRITKKLCRSLSSEELLGDVFKDGEKPPVKVTVRYMEQGAAEPAIEEWTDGESPPAAIANISVFDAENARLYVNGENKIGFLPAEVALLECHATHRREMDGAFHAEIKALNARVRVPLPAGYSPDGLVSKLFLRLVPKKDLPSEAEIRAAAAWSPKDQQELDALEKLLAQDPKALADRYRRTGSLLKAYAQELAAIDSGLSKDAAAQLQVRFDQVTATATAAAVAATELFKNEPLSGVGLPPWRLMYDYAVKYILSIKPDASGLPANPNDLCALCQQPLSPEASQRLRTFAAFINNEASKAAEAAKAALAAAVALTAALEIPASKDVERALADYRKISDHTEAVATKMIDYFAKITRRRDDLLKAARNGLFEPVAALPPSLVSEIEAEVSSLEANAAAYDKAAEAEGAKRLTDNARLSELKDRKKLSQDLETVLARLGDLQMLAKLQTCLSLVNTQQVSQQITALRRRLVTAGLENRVKAEIEVLDLTHIPFVVSDRSEGGESYFAVGLEAPVAVANDEVLSEGERRALAIACFLAEVGADESKQGLVIDDPVSSLDHIRIRRVAERLVAEAAKGRQVVIFTHNLLFFNEVIEAAAKAAPTQIRVATRIITKSEAEGFGLVSESDEPWIAQKVTKRIERLRERLKALEKHSDYNTEAYRSAVKDFYGDLRETWERLIEEVLLGKVVERFNTDVRTQSLKLVSVEDEDHKTVYWAMKRVSERCHDMAMARALPLPKPSDVQAELTAISQYHETLVKRRKELEERRVALQKPPKAKVV